MVWDAETGDLRQTLKAGSPIGDLAFSPDGKILATASDDGIVRFLDWAP